MAHSIFNGILMPETKIIFVQRKDRKGSWYLPGGAWDEDKEFETAANEWLDKLLTWKGNAALVKSGNWVLSDAAGGYEVHLHRLIVERRTTLKVKNSLSNQYIQDMQAFGIREIKHHLYESKRMPWGQAKMALYLLFRGYGGTPENTEHGLLKDDIGLVDKFNWYRP